MDYLKNLNELLSNPDFAPDIIINRLIPSREGVFAPFPDDLNEKIIKALNSKGINQLYSHQAEVWKHTQKGKNVVIVTPTASGKTLCYNLPCLNALLSDEKARCLYLFPTKALSQDQQSELNETVGWGDGLNIKIFTYDGDTPDSLRISARDNGRIIISNPDMLHSGILPNHPKWISFFSNLKFIVIDEAHVYRGVMGSHVANVIRRLKRVASFYGASPNFILCSATIANPEKLCESLIGQDVELVDKNGSPRGEKRIILYNPRETDKTQGKRASVDIESRRWMTSLLKIGIKTILFAHSRIRTEVVASYVNDDIKNLYTDNKRIRVEAYRGGFLPSERREIEKGLREGAIHGVVSTNALELGIDIGGLDASIIAGFPGSFNSFWQQSGRAGRRAATSISVFIANMSPIDQYIVNNPDWFFRKTSEEAHIDPDNPYILTDHVKCACFELPFTDDELSVINEENEKNAALNAYTENARAALEYLEESGIVRHAGGKWHWADRSYPAEGVSLRSAGADNIVIIDVTNGKNIVIGDMDRPSAKEMIFLNAVYIHRGKQYMVELLDINNKKCLVRESNVNYFTDGVVKTDIKVLTDDEIFTYDKENFKMEGVLSDVLVRSQVTKFKKIKFGDKEENIGFGDVNLSEEEIQTRAFILTFPPDSKGGKILSGMDEQSAARALSGAGTLARFISPLFLLCDPRDLGIAERARDPHFGVPSLYIYDKYPGGTGLAENLARRIIPLLGAIFQALKQCPCKNGCPSCVGIVGGKNAALKLLEAVNGNPNSD
ncbi:MAG: DEAD/DEAH box helicase [Treponema sp.]|nr:DEAD/DEAH box helicase [Treponema sp.]